MKQYVLEDENEFRRLQLQGLQKAYLPVSELEQLKEVEHVFEQGYILDAGCGSGAMTKSLLERYPNASIDGCDISDLRIHQISRELKVHKERANFFQSSLDELNEDKRYNLIICRYVYEYLKNPVEITMKFKRMLAPGGVLCLIDTDGVFVNFHTCNNSLNSQISEIQSQLHEIDFFAGRKLGTYLKQGGFNKVFKTVTVHDFQTPQEVSEEEVNMQERMNFAKTQLSRILKDENTADLFRKNYLSELRDPSNTLFFNKFVTWGINND